MRSHSELKTCDRIVGYGDIQSLKHHGTHTTCLIESYDGEHLTQYDFDGLVECVNDNDND